MTSPTESCFIFLIKTNQYAGNFEREMCAFMTGVLGDCGVGDIAAGLFSQQCPGEDWTEKVQQVVDDHGCYRPVGVWDLDSNDVAIFLEEKPTVDEVEFLRKRAMLFALDPRVGAGHSGNDEHDSRIAIKGFEVIEWKVEVTAKSLISLPPMEIINATEVV